MNAAYRLAGFLLTLALLVTATIGWGCDKHRRTYVETYGTVGVALPPPPLPPASVAVQPPPPQYSQGYQQPPAPPAQPAYAPPAEAAGPAVPQYQQGPALPAAQPQYQQTYAPPPAQPLPQGAAAQPADAADVEVLARGPVHEAFAEPVAANPAPGITVNTAPPAAVPEMPPADRPAGAIWIPGYWAWDDDRSDFIWLSGIWRIVPPGCRWVPGYWAAAQGGYQWVPGFWLPETTQQVQYLPTPPASLEAGPVGVAPSSDYVWTSGYWYRDSYQYAWRPGCWQMGRADWVWMPAHYIWTPRGCIFVTGYWDHGLGGRGLLFAPVRFARPIYAMPAYAYSPTVVIETENLSLAFFSRPRYCHYYFGDYFEASYVGLGIVPWYECTANYDWYDPIYIQVAWCHRHEDRWEAREREQYEHLRIDRAARPPRTFALQAGFRTAVQGAAGPASRPVVMAAPLADVVARKAPGVRFERLDAGRRTQAQQYATSLGAYRDQRVATEIGSVNGKVAVAQAAVAAPAGSRTTGPAIARPATVQKPDWTRQMTNRGTTDRVAPRLPEVANPKAPAAPAEVRQADVAAPSARSPQLRAVPWPVAPNEIRRQQPTSPIPQEIKRSQPQVAAAEIRRSQPTPQPMPTLARPQPQPAAPVARPQPQAAPAAPRSQAATPVQPQRVERSAPPAPVMRAAPQRIEAPRQAPPVERAAPQRIEAPRMAAPAPAAPAPAPSARPAPPTADGKERNR